MLERLLLLLARTLLETAVLFLAVAALLGLLAFRVGRRLVRDGQDPLERLSGRAAVLNGFFPARNGHDPQAAAGMASGGGEE